jgi:3-hydroxyacyl-CoA dehydrogenase
MYGPPMSRFASENIRTMTVIGAGTMGHGIAHVAALAGISVRLFDALAGGAAAGVGKIAKNLDKGVELGKLAADLAAAAKNRIRAVDNFAEACGGTDCVIEAIPERLELKPILRRCRSRKSPLRCAIHRA